MNCAPITVSGGSSSKRSEVADVEKRAEEYPDMFIANINGCKTKDNKSPRYPNPGSNVVSLNEANLIGISDNVCYTGAPTWGDAGMSSGGSSAPEPTSEGAPTTTEAPTPSVSLGGAVGVPDFTGEPQLTTTEPPAVVPTSSSTLVPVAPAPTSAPSTPSTPTEGGLSGPCTDEGAWNCVGGSSFQRCASGTWTEVQGLAGGTECTPGQAKDFAVKAIEVKSRMLKEKRSRRRSHGHEHA